MSVSAQPGELLLHPAEPAEPAETLQRTLDAWFFSAGVSLSEFDAAVVVDVVVVFRAVCGTMNPSGCVMG